jgi:molybdopterin-guanine dinucleotide biosynthesis protein A
MPTERNLPAAVVLAGGRSTRMGRDKSLLTLDGKPLVAHVLDRLRPQVRAVAINANVDLARFASFGVPVLADTLPNHPGPLAGLLTGMGWARGIGAEKLVSVPTDSPFVPRDLVQRLMDAAVRSPDRPALAASSGRRHPVVGLWPVELVRLLGDFLAAGETYKVAAFADRCGAVTVEFPLITLAGREMDPFFNINTPDDLALAETVLEELRQ